VKPENPGMDKSKARLVLRVCLLALFALIVLSIGLAVVSDKLLPTELAEWHHRNNAGDFGFSDVLELMFWGAGMLLFFISMIGLFFYQRWAAWMMLAVLLVFSLQVLFSPSVEPGLLTFVGGWSDVVTGLVLGLAFFTDALSEGA
jgi:Zn-dependent protease with chaperone function